MSAHRECALCRHPEGFEPQVLGRLIGPVGENARSKEPLWVHRECAIWSPEAYETGDGHIRGISKILKRGRVTWCAGCQKRGATIGCRLDACQHSYHKYCAKQAGCTFYPDQYLIACKAHARLYAAHTPAEGQTPLSPFSPYPVGRAQASSQGGLPPTASALGLKRLRETPPEERLHNARRAIKRLRHEARAAELAGSDDEEHFQKKDKARLARDKLRLNPVVLGQKRKHAEEAPAAAPVQAVAADNNVVAEGWGAVGGHAAVIQQLKEMVLLPLQYPHLFKHMGITPPRGILFHGSPGTGKTLVARALAGACSQNSSTPVTLFARKGADCLGKFAGEAERTLRLLFDEAARRAPSIIFLDELDGLVPARSSNSSSSDQVFASVVSTLLALMDGVVDRGAVVVIGATNRPEAIDPALRRPGRFDREVHFGLPSALDRAAILKVHTTRWQQSPSDALLKRVAASTEGFAGADLQALCTAAVMAAVSRTAPDLVDQLCDQAVDLGCMQQQGQEQQQPNKQRQQQGHNADGQERKQGQQAATNPQGRHEQQQNWQQQQDEQPQQQQWEDQEHQHQQQQQDQHQTQDQVQHADDLLQNGQQATQGKQGQQGQLQRKLPGNLLQKLQVKAIDWRTAQAAAPLPCSARQNLSALSSGHAKALPYHLGPLLLPNIIRALQCIAAAQLPWQGTPAAALEAATAAADKVLTADEADGEAAAVMPEADDPEGRRKLEILLTELGAVQGPSHVQTGAVPSQSSPRIPLPDPTLEHPHPRPCKLLLCGPEHAGQGQVAGALLKLLQGVQVHTVSLPVLVVGGSGDAAAGLVQVLEEALRRATCHLPLMLYLPSIEAWALEAATISLDEGDTGQAAAAGQAGNGPTPSRNAQPSITPLKSYPASISPFRGLVSLQARQGGSGGSRGNPASGPSSGPASARKATPAPARHLAFHQASPHKQCSISDRTTMISPRTNSEAPPSPILSLPSPRPSRAAIHSPGPAALRSPSLSLPSPSAPDQNPGSAVENFFSPTAAKAEWLAADKALPEEEEQHKEVEVYVLSEIWKVFEQILKQIPATQPLLVLATCQRGCEELPSALLTSFQTQPSGTHLMIHEPMAALSRHAGSAASSGVIAMGSEAEPASSWQQAANRAAEAAAVTIASAAASRFRAELSQATAASTQHVIQVGPLGNACEDTSSSAAHCPRHLQGVPRAVGDNLAANGLSEPAGSGLAATEAAPQTRLAETSRGAKAVNENELQQGMALHAEVQRRIQLCGQHLCMDRRLKYAQAPIRASDLTLDAAEAGPSPPVRLAVVAQQAQQGQFESLPAFAGAVRKAVVATCLAVEGRSRQGNRQSGSGSTGHSVRAAAACALADDVALRCHTISQQLNLTDPTNQRLIAAAQQHIALRQTQQPNAGAAPRGQAVPVQQRRTDRAQSSGLMTSSDDSSNLDEQDMSQHQRKDRSDPAVDAVDQERAGGEAHGPEHAVPAVPAVLATQSAAEASIDVSNPQISLSTLTEDVCNHSTVSTQVPNGLVNPLHQSRDSGRVVISQQAGSSQPVPVPQQPQVRQQLGDVQPGSVRLGNVQQQRNTQRLGNDAQPHISQQAEGTQQADQIHAQHPSMRQQPGSDQQAGNSQQLASNEQVGNAEQPTSQQQADNSQQPTSHQRLAQNPEGERQLRNKRQGQRGMPVQDKLRLQRSCLKMRSDLQACLQNVFLEAFGKSLHSLPALQQCHDSLIAAALEQLPVAADSLPASLDPVSLSRAAETWLHQMQTLLVSGMQAFVTDWDVTEV